jgi:hypothetical protein
MTTMITPNAPEGTANEQNAVPSLDSLAAKMNAMREGTQRNQLRATDEAETGDAAEANAESPVAPDGEEAVPEIAEYNDIDGESTEEEQAQETVSEGPDADSTSDELIDFIEFAETNPNAKFKFMRNGKEVVVDAKKAAAILGQGSAIHEDARQLKIQKAEFDEYLTEHRARQEGLTLAMEFTVQPQLQKAYDEIVKTQNYQSVFQQQLAQTRDAAQQTRIRASMQQNERYIQQQGAVINQLQPNIEQFRDLRRQQVAEVLETNRKSFTDKELKNEYVYNELRDKISKTWKGSTNEIVPGIKNLDLVSSDETLLGLVRDGLKFRDRPSSKAAGSSLATLTGRKATSTNSRGGEDSIDKLRQQAKGGDKKAADNLLMQQLSKLRASRASR